VPNMFRRSGGDHQVISETRSSNCSCRRKMMSRRLMWERLMRGLSVERSALLALIYLAYSEPPQLPRTSFTRAPWRNSICATGQSDTDVSNAARATIKLLARARTSCATFSRCG
jgi:hypothetical protein